MDDIVKEFLIESHEGLDRLDQDLIALEREPTNPDLLAAIFRCIHTIKGTCGFLAFTALESVSHVGESLLSKMRDGEIHLNEEITNALLAMVDAIRGMLASVEAVGTDGGGDYSDLIARLEALQTGESETPPPPATKRTRKKKAPAKTARTEAAEVTEVAEVPAPAVEGPPSESNEDLAPRGAVSETSVRIGVDLLDHLMNLVGELVLARNQVLQYTEGEADSNLTASAQHLDLITTELQEGVMKTRMQPIGNIWNKFPRVVRDLAVSCGKDVEVQMEGQDTELDKTLIEAIKDPLTHIVRNSVDHGIEPPDAREAAGKRRQATVFLRAFHEGGQVNLEIADDGAGINVEKVKAKAVQRGLVTAEDAAAMTDREATGLIFRAGFSTADAVTNVSGRGVGMDVVRTNIERIGGSVDVRSVPQQGTTLRIKIPLTLAIIPALVVKCGEHRFAIPQVSLLELVRLDGGEAAGRIEHIHGAPVYRLRGRLLPLVFLSQELRVAAEEDAIQNFESINIVVLQANDREFGLVVDGVSDTAEIVVKPLGKLLKTLSLFAGATIMGDGRVALILDVLGLAQRARVVTGGPDRAVTDRGLESEDLTDARQTILLFKTQGDGRMAIPLSAVARLEEFSSEAIERAGGHEMVQYRGSILPLIHVSQVLPERRTKPRVAPDEDGSVRTGALHVVVYAEGSRTVGLVVDRILDIVHEKVSIEHPASREGVQGTAVIQERVTEFLDVAAVIRRGDPTFFQQVSDDSPSSLATHG